MPSEVAAIAERGMITPGDVTQLQGMVQVDDDNQTFPYNIPAADDDNNSIFEAEFGHSGFCYRQMEGAPNVNAQVNNMGNVVPTHLQLPEHFLPTDYIKELLIPETKKELERPSLTYGEFLV